MKVGLGTSSPKALWYQELGRMGDSSNAQPHYPGR